MATVVPATTTHKHFYRIPTKQQSWLGHSCSTVGSQIMATIGPRRKPCGPSCIMYYCMLLFEGVRASARNALQIAGSLPEADRRRRERDSLCAVSMRFRPSASPARFALVPLAERARALPLHWDGSPRGWMSESSLEILQRIYTRDKKGPKDTRRTTENRQTTPRPSHV